MKILWCIDHLGPGGAQKLLCDLVEEAGKFSQQQLVLCLNDHVHPSNRGRIQAAGASILVVGKLRVFSGIGLLGVAYKLRSQGFDAIVTSLLGSDLIGLPLGWLIGIPVRVSSQQSINSHYSKLICVGLRQSLGLATMIVLNSFVYQKDIERRYLPKGKKTVVISTGISVGKKTGRDRDSHDLLETQARARQSLGILDDGCLIGSAGRLSPEKCFDLLISVIKKSDRKDLSLVIAGIGPERDKLLSLIKRNALDDRVTLLGHVEDMQTFFQSIDAYVQSSSFEGMPLALMEAMAAGCPVIASRVGGVSDLIPNEQYGLTFASGDEEELSQKLSVLVNDPEQAIFRARQGQQRIEELFSKDRMLKEWTALFRKLK